MDKDPQYAHRIQYHQKNEDIRSPHKGSEDAFEFWIHVDEIYELPSTGGIGTYWYTLGGFALMMSTVLSWYKNKRKEVLGE